MFYLSVIIIGILSGIVICFISFLPFSFKRRYKIASEAKYQITYNDERNNVLNKNIEQKSANEYK